jgi:hypothetical protein
MCPSLSYIYILDCGIFGELIIVSAGGRDYRTWHEQVYVMFYMVSYLSICIMPRWCIAWVACLFPSLFYGLTWPDGHCLSQEL